MSQPTVNQRFMLFLNTQKITQSEFADKVGMKSQNVSNIITDNVDQPKSEFFVAIARHYPGLSLRWLLLGEGEMLLPGGGGGMHVLKEEGPVYGGPPSRDAELERLVRTVERLSETIAHLTRLVNDVPALREEVEALRKRLAEVEAGRP